MKEILVFLNNNDFITGFILLLLGMAIPELYQYLKGLLQQKPKEMKVHAGLYNVLQTKAKLSDDELQDLIEDQDQIISHAKNSSLSPIEEQNKIIEWAEENKKMYIAHLNAKKEIACLDSLLQVKMNPQKDGQKYRVQNVTFFYDHKSVADKVLEFLRLKVKTSTIKNLPSDFHRTYSGITFDKLDPLVISYSYDKDFLEAYLGKDLLDIMLTDSSENQWLVPKNEIKRLKNREPDQFTD